VDCKDRTIKTETLTVINSVDRQNRVLGTKGDRFKKKISLIEE